MPRRRLPSLVALRAFEAAARHQSFKSAAAELAVTPTAVSHQIRALEEELGVRLFERRPRSVRLTQEGAILFPVLREGFDGFARVVETIRRPRERRAVTISATTAFTARWLVPRVQSFREAHPDLDLRLHASNERVDLHAGEADLAIRYGDVRNAGLVSEPLVRDSFGPVWSPRLRIRRPEDVLAHPLLEVAWRRFDADTPTWDRWLERARLSRRAAKSTRITFNDEALAFQAALGAQGVALLGTVMVEAELSSGALVRSFGPLLEGHMHRLVHLPGAERREEIAAVRDWLLRAMRANQR